MAKDFCHPKVVAGYDEHIVQLIPGYALMHAQVRATLTVQLTAEAHILVVGCGTGYEIEYLLADFPKIHITAVDPSLNMLQKAQQKIAEHADSSRVNWLLGTTADLKPEAQFDAALCLLVAHFIANDQKTEFFQQIYQHLKPKAYLMTYDMLLPSHANELKILQHLCQVQGLSVRQSEQMLERLEDDFALITPQQYCDTLLKVGFNSIQTYLQVINYFGFLAQK
ncbi:trans-aconitate 2-methyltransferase [uncultured Acinetobacter sp.]|uniref:class I SAM-dependent methyltransferase n=1 Tax=uncultured Acinetobacter sp. TaxID=165433 RepID=UPI002608D7CE|nr:class I SAM-dependent methyltransferase [uncultured Acinetobacter sp.]